MNRQESYRPGRITPHARPERPVRQSTPLGAWPLITGILAGLLCGGLAYCKRKPEPRVWLHEPVAKERRK